MQLHEQIKELGKRIGKVYYGHMFIDVETEEEGKHCVELTDCGRRLKAICLKKDISKDKTSAHFLLLGEDNNIYLMKVLQTKDRYGVQVLDRDYKFEEGTHFENLTYLDVYTTLLVYLDNAKKNIINKELDIKSKEIDDKLTELKKERKDIRRNYKKELEKNPDFAYSLPALR